MYLTDLNSKKPGDIIFNNGRQYKIISIVENVGYGIIDPFFNDGTGIAPLQFISIPTVSSINL